MLTLLEELEILLAEFQDLSDKEEQIHAIKINIGNEIIRLRTLIKKEKSK